MKYSRRLLIFACALFPSVSAVMCQVGTVGDNVVESDCGDDITGCSKVNVESSIMNFLDLVCGTNKADGCTTYDVMGMVTENCSCTGANCYNADGSANESSDRDANAGGNPDAQSPPFSCYTALSETLPSSSIPIETQCPDGVTSCARYTTDVGFGNASVTLACGYGDNQPAGCTVAEASGISVETCYCTSNRCNDAWQGDPNGVYGTSKDVAEQPGNREDGVDVGAIMSEVEAMVDRKFEAFEEYLEMTMMAALEKKIGKILEKAGINAEASGDKCAKADKKSKCNEKSECKWDKKKKVCAARESKSKDRRLIDMAESLED